jgi:hypothetical protein
MAAAEAAPALALPWDIAEPHCNWDPCDSKHLNANFPPGKLVLLANAVSGVVESTAVRRVVARIITVVASNAVRSWKETCTVPKASVEGLIDEGGQSLVVEGVRVIPSANLIERREKAEGVAIGCLLTITEENAHVCLLRLRGFSTFPLVALQRTALKWNCVLM